MSGEIGVDEAALEIHVGDHTHELAALAHEAGEQRFEQRLEKYGRVKRTLTNMVARDFLILKETRQARAEMLAADNLYLHTGASQEEYRQAALADFDRFSGEHDKLLVDEAAGEKRTEVAAGQPDEFHERLKWVVRGLVSGEMSPAALGEEKKRMLAHMGNADEGRATEGRMYADNLTEVAELVKVKMAAGETLDAVLGRTKVYVDQVRLGVRTEAHFSGVEKLLEKIHDSKAGSLVGNETMVSAVAAAYTVGKWSARRVASTAGRLAAPFVAAGVMAGWRERSRITAERGQHERQRAQGMAGPEAGTRRAEFEKLHYEARPAGEMRSEVLRALYEHNDKTGLEPRDITRDEYVGALGMVAEIETRRQLSAERGVDLISYSSAVGVGRERRDLYLTAATAKVRLREVAAAHPEWNGRDEPLPRFNNLMRARRGQYEQDISRKDALFRAFRRREVAKAMGKGALLGAGVGLVASELVAMVRPGEQGVVEAWRHSDQQAGHSTLLRELIGGHDNSPREVPAAARVHEVLTQTSVVRPEHVSASEFMAMHSDKTIKIDRQMWASGNDTKLHWGGEHGSGIDADGNYVYNVSQMTAHAGGESPSQLAEHGRLSMLLSADAGSQDRVFAVPVDAHGNAVIDAKSPAGELFRRSTNGHAVFEGRYAEVAEVRGSDGARQANIFATYVGSGKPELTVNVTETVNRYETIAGHDINGAEVNSARGAAGESPGQRIDVPIVAPVVSRRTLEPAPGSDPDRWTLASGRLDEQTRRAQLETARRVVVPVARAVARPATATRPTEESVPAETAAETPSVETTASVPAETAPEAAARESAEAASAERARQRAEQEAQPTPAWKSVPTKTAISMSHELAYNMAVSRPEDGLVSIMHTSSHDETGRERIQMSRQTAERAFAQTGDSGDGVARVRRQIGAIVENWRVDQLDGVVIGLSETEHEGRPVMAAFVAQRNGHVLVVRNGEIVNDEVARRRNLPPSGDVQIAALRVVPGDILLAYDGASLDAGKLTEIFDATLTEAEMATRLRRLTRSGNKGIERNAAVMVVPGGVLATESRAPESQPVTPQSSVAEGQSLRDELGEIFKVKPDAAPASTAPETPSAPEPEPEPETPRAPEAAESRAPEAKATLAAEVTRINSALDAARRTTELNDIAGQAAAAGLLEAQSIEDLTVPVWQRYKPASGVETNVWDRLLATDQRMRAVRTVDDKLKAADLEGYNDETKNSVAALRAWFADPKTRLSGSEWRPDEVQTVLNIKPSRRVMEAVRSQLIDSGQLIWEPPANYEPGKPGVDPYQARGSKYEAADDAGELVLGWFEKEAAKRRKPIRRRSPRQSNTGTAEGNETA